MKKIIVALMILSIVASFAFAAVAKDSSAAATGKTLIGIAMPETTSSAG
jgi:hypothetical protein